MFSGLSLTRSIPHSLELAFLGTASQSPSVHRGLSSILMKLVNDDWLFDCGEGTARQLHILNARKRRDSDIDSDQAMPFAFRRLTAAFITHLHADHVGGLMSLMLNRARTGGPQAPMLVCGPQGIVQYLDNLMRATRTARLPPFHFIELIPRKFQTLLPRAIKKRGKDLMRESLLAGGLDEVAMQRMPPRGPLRDSTVTYVSANEQGVWPVIDTPLVSLTAAPLLHTVPCFGYVYNEKVASGSINGEYVRQRLLDNSEWLIARGTRQPLTLFKKLQMGECVLLQDGVLDPQDPQVMSAHTARKVCILGDTHDASATEQAARDCQLLVHEATNNGNSAADWQAARHFAVSHGHSTAEMAGETARAMAAKHLLLTHFSTRYLPRSAGRASDGLLSHIERAAMRRAGHNNVTAMEDFATVLLDRNGALRVSLPELGQAERALPEDPEALSEG